MLDDKDEFKKTNIYAGYLLLEAQTLIVILRNGPPWHRTVRDFMVKYHTELDVAISEARE